MWWPRDQWKGVLVIGILAIGCDSAPGEGEQCRFGRSVGSTEVACQEGLYCSLQVPYCRRPVGEGKTCTPTCGWSNPCDFFCADGLVCDLPGHPLTCAPPADEGALCRSNAGCAAGLICNHGYLPDDTTLGECHPPSNVGQPCSYTQYRMDGSGHAGCLPSLTCVAPAPTAASIVDNPPVCVDLGGSGDPSCGFAGICAPLFSVPIGDACLGGGACADQGNCNVLPDPYSFALTRGFACTGGTGKNCWSGPWTGLCGPSPTTTEGATGGADCTARACAPGFLCDWLGVCRPRWSALQLNQCGAYGTAAPLADFCEIGLQCIGDPPQCQPR